MRLPTDLSAETLQPEESGKIYPKCWKKKQTNKNPTTYNPTKYSTRQDYHSELKKI